jgi:hyperosmotically inducible periplasmic protein
MHRSFTSAVCGIVLSGAFLLGGNLQAAQNQDTDQHKADDTAVNKRDRDKTEATADQAKNNLSDRQLMKQIRRDVVKDKSLSTYGHNVKIIADHGKVTLKGPVHSDDEKNAILEHAKKYTGGNSIDDQLTVEEKTK